MICTTVRLIIIFNVATMLGAATQAQLPISSLDAALHFLFKPTYIKQLPCINNAKEVIKFGDNSALITTPSKIISVNHSMHWIWFYTNFVAPHFTKARIISPTSFATIGDLAAPYVHIWDIDPRKEPICIFDGNYTIQGVRRDIHVPYDITIHNNILGIATSDIIYMYDIKNAQHLRQFQFPPEFKLPNPGFKSLLSLHQNTIITTDNEHIYTWNWKNDIHSIEGSIQNPQIYPTSLPNIYICYEQKNNMIHTLIVDPEAATSRITASYESSKNITQIISGHNTAQLLALECNADHSHLHMGNIVTDQWDTLPSKGEKRITTGGFFDKQHVWVHLANGNLLLCRIPNYDVLNHLMQERFKQSINNKKPIIFQQLPNNLIKLAQHIQNPTLYPFPVEIRKIEGFAKIFGRLLKSAYQADNITFTQLIRSFATSYASKNHLRLLLTIAPDDLVTRQWAAYRAIRRDDQDSLNMLLNYKKTLYPTDLSPTILHEAITILSRNHLNKKRPITHNCLSHLLNYRIDSNILHPLTGATALHMALSAYISPDTKLWLVTTLLQHGARPNIPTKDGVLPLDLALYGNAPNCAAVLQSEGAYSHFPNV